jgi:hypothetical protein
VPGCLSYAQGGVQPLRVTSRLPLLSPASGRPPNLPGLHHIPRLLVCLHPGGTLRRPLPAVILRAQGNVAACQSALLEKPAYSLAVVDVRPEPPALSTDL